MPKIDEALAGREDREDRYRRWSERAVIVGYNSENQTYDIVVTTERLSGANKRTLNKTIRRVKSLLDSNVRTFLPGEAVAVGYISDKREHPLILGLGDNVVQTPVRVTLGPTLDVEGEKTIDLTPDDELNDVITPTPCTGNLLDSLTGSTTTLTVDCSTLDINNCFLAEVGAPTGCGCGQYTWTITDTLVGFTVSADIIGGLTLTLQPFGGGDSSIKICPPVNNGSGATAARLNYVFKRRCGSPFSGFCCCVAQTNLFTCNGTPIGDCEGGGDSIVIDCTCNTGCGSAVSCGESGAFQPAGCVSGGSSCPNFPDLCALADCTNDLLFNFTCREDLRSAALISGGCQPCELMFDHSMLTATDACGLAHTIEIVFAQ